MDKLITIVIATYNASKSIKRCLDSIISQKNESIELIIVDGVSDDGTIEAVNEYQENVDVFISERDRGIYDAWNKGIQKASGKWIMFVGADDTLEPGALESYESFLMSTDAKDLDYICAKNNYLSLDGSKIKVIGTEWRWSEFRKTMGPAHVASLHSIKLFEQVGVFDLDYKLCADYELLMRKRDQLRVAYLDTIIANMYVGGMSLSVSALKETYRIRKKYSSLSLIENLCMLNFRILLYYRFKYLKLK